MDFSINKMGFDLKHQTQTQSKPWVARASLGWLENSKGKYQEEKRVEPTFFKESTEISIFFHFQNIQEHHWATKVFRRPSIRLNQTWEHHDFGLESVKETHAIGKFNLKSGTGAVSAGRGLCYAKQE